MPSAGRSLIVVTHVTLMFLFVCFLTFKTSSERKPGIETIKDAFLLLPFAEFIL